ncbi:hypothetical protein JYU34_019760 [Plutella xylostella]|uniref:Uncharacterized protein n=1 Tax=Plutella xylostella TaxID=51655 RepID=A0ABQ7PVE6_PLUXY|nr:hypothetical protein JYU34_019760 [Plutella xylostella]
MMALLLATAAACSQQIQGGRQGGCNCTTTEEGDVKPDEAVNRYYLPPNMCEVKIYMSYGTREPLLGFKATVCQKFTDNSDKLAKLVVKKVEAADAPLAYIVVTKPWFCEEPVSVKLAVTRGLPEDNPYYY